ncbi:hypothetical protein Tco_0601621 [Tanacetum coccineum]
MKWEKSREKRKRDQLQQTLEKFQNSSKSLNDLLESQVIDKFKTGLGYSAATAASPAVESFVNLSDKSDQIRNSFSSPTLTGRECCASINEELVSDGHKGLGEINGTGIIKRQKLGSTLSINQESLRSAAKTNDKDVMAEDFQSRCKFTLSPLDVLQGFSFFLQMGFTLILATLDGLDVGLLGDVIGEDDCDDDGCECIYSGGKV